MADTPSSRTIDAVSAPTFVLAHSPGFPAADGPDEVVVETDYDTSDHRYISLTTSNEALFAATTSPTSATRAYGMGAKMDAATARRIADALTVAADEADKFDGQ
jgi:hypothetical protein